MIRWRGKIKSFLFQLPLLFNPATFYFFNPGLSNQQESGGWRFRLLVFPMWNHWQLDYSHILFPVNLGKGKNYYNSSSGFNEVEGNLENVGLCIQESEELETRTRRVKWPSNRVVLG